MGNNFTKKYKEYSEYQNHAKKKTINKVIKFSIEELDYLQAPQSLISKINRFAI